MYAYIPNHQKRWRIRPNRTTLFDSEEKFACFLFERQKKSDLDPVVPSPVLPEDSKFVFCV